MAFSKEELGLFSSNNNSVSLVILCQRLLFLLYKPSLSLIFFKKNQLNLFHCASLLDVSHGPAIPRHPAVLWCDQ